MRATSWGFITACLVVLVAAQGVVAAAPVLKTNAGGKLVARTSMTVHGDVSFNSAGTLVIGLNGAAPGQFGFINAGSGGAVVNGALKVELGFSPAVGDEFTILHAGGGLSGTFTGLPHGTKVSAGTRGFFVHYTSGTDVKLKTTLPDFVVNLADPPFDLFAATGVTPGTGAFTGAGVSGNVFSPVVVGLGTFTSTFTPSGGGSPITFTITVINGIDPTLTLKGSPLFRAQTGLFEVRLTIVNTTPVTINGFRASVTNLPVSLKLYNATSPTGATPPYADHAYPVAVGEQVVMTLLFYSPTRTWPAGYVPAITLTTLLAPVDTTVSGTGIAVTRVVPQTDGSLLIEWPSVIGKWYRVKFSNDNMVTWLASQVPIKASTTRTQWIDKGPPFTNSHPSTVPSRFYKVEVITP